MVTKDQLLNLQIGTKIKYHGPSDNCPIDVTSIWEIIGKPTTLDEFSKIICPAKLISFEPHQFNIFIIGKEVPINIPGSSYPYLTILNKENISSTKITSDLYCTCNGPVITNNAGGKEFKVCKICKKEQL